MKNVWGWKMGKEKPVLDSRRERKKTFNRIAHLRFQPCPTLSGSPPYPLVLFCSGFFFFFTFPPTFRYISWEVEQAASSSLRKPATLGSHISIAVVLFWADFPPFLFSLLSLFIFKFIFSLSSLRTVSPIIRSVDIACAPRERGRRDWSFLTKQK